MSAACAAVVRWQMEHGPHPEQGYPACLGLMPPLRSVRFTGAQLPSSGHG